MPKRTEALGPRPYLKKNISKLVVNTTIDPHHKFTSPDDNETVDISSFIFNFSPTKNIYICNNGTCEEHNLKDAKRHRDTATINGNKAYTRSDCFGSCNWKYGNNHIVDSVNNITAVKDVQTFDAAKCDNNWCVALTIVLVVLIILTILVLR